MAEKLTSPRRRRLTRLGQALSERLRATGQPVITDYQLFLELRQLYLFRNNLYLRKPIPEINDHRRAKGILYDNNILSKDEDYAVHVHRIMGNSDLPADEICCIVDPFCYISHMSSMQRFGLTNRRPDALHLTVPGPRIIRQLIHERMQQDYETYDGLDPSQVEPLTSISHPERVRKRKVDVYHTVHYGAWVSVRGSFARIATIGQIFLDMVSEPVRCGGMAHVLDVWREHAGHYRDEIIQSVDCAPAAIIKVRAGYILSEVLGIHDTRIDAWKRFAQRGGSRRLDPTKPYTPQFSEQWMISINV